jgi:hypothetical protein
LLGFAMASEAPGDGVQNEPLAMSAVRARTARPWPLRRGQRLGERRRRDEREHEGKGYFHWVDLCFGHYWDTGAVRH